METTQIPRATASYLTRIDRTLEELQNRVKEHEAVLEQVSSNILQSPFFSNTVIAPSVYISAT